MFSDDFLEVLATKLADRIAQKLAAAAPPATPPSQSDYLTTKQVAEILSRGTSTVENWRAQGEGPHWHKLETGGIRYRRADLDEWIQSNRRAKK